MLHAAGKCDCCRRVDALSEWLHKNLDEAPAIGPDSVAAAEAAIRKLKGRVAELEAELADTLEDAVRHGTPSYDETFCSDGHSTWRHMMERLVDLGRFKFTYASASYQEGRFLPRKEAGE